MQQTVRHISLIFRKLPKFRYFLLGLIIVIVLIITMQRIYICNALCATIKTSKVTTQEIIYLLQQSSKIINQIKQQKENISHSEIDCKTVRNTTINHMISTGDTLTSVLNHYNININDIIQLALIDKELNHLKIGQLFSLKITDSELQHLIWKISNSETRTYNKVSNNFKISNKIQHVTWINSVLKGTIDDNFVSSALNAGLTISEVHAVMKVMQQQIDCRNLKKGDRFIVLINREMLGNKHKHSKLVVVHLCCQDKDYYAIRAADGKFYDRNGNSLIHGFLRFPTSKKFRVSSNFSPCRLNPITGRLAPHRGVDFAMPQGTPVLAVGDGEVVAAKNSNMAGYYITVNHGHTYTTRYMHLHKLLVKPGQKVKQGDRIALSGNTGYSTGPHLHYELWINQEAVNPLTAKLPHTQRLTGQNWAQYLMKIKEVIPYLNTNQPFFTVSKKKRC